jgi:hypothetical protein
MAISPASAGSRSGLITWAVISTILSVACLVWAIISYSSLGKATDDLTALRAAYKEIAPETALKTAPVTTLQAIKKRAGSGNRSLLDVAWATRNDVLSAFASVNGTDAGADLAALAQLQTVRDRATAVLAGKSPDTAAAPAAATGAEGGDAAAAAPATGTAADGAITSASSGIEVINELIKYAVDQRTARETAEASLAAAQQAFAASTQAQSAQLATYQQSQLDPANQRATSAEQTASKATEDATQQVSGLTQAATAREQELQAQVSAVNGQLAKLTDDLSAANTKINKLEAEKEQNKPDQILRHPDGRILRVEGTDRVVINLGQGDALPAGMTFEVYDPKLGVPRASDSSPESDAQLRGKASIQVLKVNQGSSECRVIKTANGQTINEGDIIANVIYDRNNKFQFMVFGKFNLDRRGVATERDGELVKRLVQQWGGGIADNVTNDTDFVVLGVEPLVPSYTAEELQSDPLKEQELQQAKAALDAYNDIRSKAQQMNVPILNQNRFLYLIGYYDEATR